MSLTIPDEIIRSTRMSIPELTQEITVLLVQKEKLTLGQASGLANLSQFHFKLSCQIVKFPFIMANKILRMI